MLLLGVLLLGASGAFICLLIAYNSSGGPEYDVAMFGHHLAMVNGPRIFLAGIALTLLFGLGGAMTMAGGARARGRRGELRKVRAEARRTAAERDALAKRLDTSAPATDAATPVVMSKAGTGPDAPVAGKQSVMTGLRRRFTS